MRLEKTLIEDMFLIERKCLKIPEYLAISINDYAQVVFDMANVCMLQKNTPSVISCYSRQVLPTMFEDTCLIADISYVEFLADYVHWSRMKDDELIKAIFCKYMLNQCLYQSDYITATFYEWLIREKRYILPHFSSEDYQEAFLINAVALMHEIFHFVKGFEDYDDLFREHDINQHVEDTGKTILEGRCDFMGLTILLNKGIGIQQTSEQIVEKYLQMMAANCIYQAIIENKSRNNPKPSSIKDFMDRIYSTIHFLYGMKCLFPNLDMNKVNLNSLNEAADGLKCLMKFVTTDILQHAEKYKGLAETHKKALYQEIINQESDLRSHKAFIVYPE